jgi:hypothetical protein
MKRRRNLLRRERYRCRLSNFPDDPSALGLRNLYRCLDCCRLRGCPYEPMHLLDVLDYVACSCGDAAVDESSADAAARAAALRYLIANNLF